MYYCGCMFAVTMKVQKFNNLQWYKKLNQAHRLQMIKFVRKVAISCVESHSTCVFPPKNAK